MSERWVIASIESERTVVGGCLVHPKSIDDCLGIVLPEDFSDSMLGSIFAAIVELDGASLPVDAVTVWNHMSTLGTAAKLRHKGGIDALTNLMSDVVTIENIGYHGTTVARLADRRRWAADLRELAVRAGDEGMGNAEFFSEVEGRVLQLMMQRKASTSTLLGSHQAMKQLVAEIEARYDEKDADETRGIPTGFWALDAASGGWRPGQLIVLAARPRVGKSAWAGNAIEYAARKGIPSLLFQLEMDKMEVYERMVSSNGIKADTLRTGRLSPDQFITLTKTAGDLAHPERIWVDDQQGINIAELRSRARRWRARQGAGDRAQIYVDFLQLVKSARRGDVDPQVEIFEVAYGLKELAKELRCTVVALAQLNKEVDRRDNQRPRLADLKGGSIEAAADIVLFLYRDEIADPECAQDKRGIAELSIGKGRGLPPGHVYKLQYNGSITKFSNPKA